jgi:phospholipid transport system transporter-binding protein
VTAESLELEGGLTFGTLNGILEQTAAFVARRDLPDCLSIDLAKVDEVDSSAVALLLRWRREAQRLGKRVEFLHLPPNLAALAALYGVADIVQPEQPACS